MRQKNLRRKLWLMNFSQVHDISGYCQNFKGAKSLQIFCEGLGRMDLIHKIWQEVIKQR